jgi:hypothetical protein
MHILEIRQNQTCNLSLKENSRINWKATMDSSFHLINLKKDKQSLTKSSLSNFLKP